MGNIISEYISKWEKNKLNSATMCHKNLQVTLTIKLILNAIKNVLSGDMNPV